MDIRASIWKSILAKFAAASPPPQEIVDLLSSPDMMKALEEFRKSRLAEFSAADPSAAPDHYRREFSLLDNEQRMSLLRDYMSKPEAGKAPELSEAEILEAQEVAQTGLRSLEDEPSTSHPWYAPPAALKTKIMALLEKSLGRKAADTEDVAEWIAKRHRGEDLPVPEVEPEDEEEEGAPEGTEAEPDEPEKAEKEYGEGADILEAEPGKRHEGKEPSKTLWFPAEIRSLSETIAKIPQTWLEDPNSEVANDAKSLMQSLRGLEGQSKAMEERLIAAAPEEAKEIRHDMAAIEESAKQMRKNFDDKWLPRVPGAAAEEETPRAYDVVKVKEYQDLAKAIDKKQDEMDAALKKGPKGLAEAMGLRDEIEAMIAEKDELEDKLREGLKKAPDVPPGKMAPYTGMSPFSPEELEKLEKLEPEKLGEEDARKELSKLKGVITTGERILERVKEYRETGKETGGTRMQKVHDATRKYKEPDEYMKMLVDNPEQEAALKRKLTEWSEKVRKIEEYLSAYGVPGAKTQKAKPSGEPEVPFEEQRAKWTPWEELLAQPVEKIFDKVKTKEQAIQAINALRQLSTRPQLGGKGDIRMQSLMKRLVKEGLEHLVDKFGKDISDEWTRINQGTPELPAGSVASILHRLLRNSEVSPLTLPEEAQWEWDAETLAADAPGGAWEALYDVNRAIAEGADERTAKRLLELRDDLREMVARQKGEVKKHQEEYGTGLSKVELETPKAPETPVKRIPSDAPEYVAEQLALREEEGKRPKAEEPRPKAPVPVPAEGAEGPKKDAEAILDKKYDELSEAIGKGDNKRANEIREEIRKLTPSMIKEELEKGRIRKSPYKWMFEEGKDVKREAPTPAPTETKKRPPSPGELAMKDPMELYREIQRRVKRKPVEPEG